MITHLRLAFVALMIAVAAGTIGAAQADAAPACVSQDLMAARLRAEGFTAPAANNFAHFISEDCLSAAA
jgi:hypothetical protein